MKKIALTVLLIQALGLSVYSQLKTNDAALARSAADHREKELASFRRALDLAKEKGWELSFKTPGSNIAFLVGVDRFGYPVYYSTENNIIAAATIRTNVLWPGGSAGLNLSGSSANIKDKMGVWDGGRVLETHVELANRVNQKDVVGTVSDHATHVAGTMVAGGINPLAKGMAYGTQRISAYDFNNDASEMFAEAQNLLLSNHSYGTVTGWRFNEGQNRWEFHGRFGDNEDYKFGYYDDRAQLLDSMAYNAPNYLIVKSAGNNRSENGPAVGQTYWRFNATGQMTNAGARPAGIANNDGFDIISTYGTAKNILTVGAISGLPYGYNKSEEVLISSFSSFGPTDDGRIKPDIVADGVNLLSSTGGSNSSYSAFSGTSMSAPSTTGSLLLLQEYYSQLHGSFMRSATLKALAIHTADEAGDNAGPDYKFGWGVVNIGKAAEVIKSNNAGSHEIHEKVLASGGNFTTNVVASGNGPLVATIVWTDPKGKVEQVNVLNNTAKKLVNDLDIRITKGATTYMPWILNPSVPDAPASKGDNTLDNVERININDAVPGETYTITVSHKNALERGAQAYSLVLSGIGGQAYCTSAASSTAGARINNVTFGSINNNNPAGCTSYSSFTNLTTLVEPGQTIPFNITTGSCDASNNTRFIKVFIDFNNNGNFTDAGELVMTSGPVTGTTASTGNITIPATVIAGNTSVMRVVVQEAAAASELSPCGSYGNGETHDYRVIYRPASNDVAVMELVTPLTGSCSNPNQLVTVRLRNTGNVDKSNIPLTVLVKQGATVVANLNATYTQTIDASGVATFTFQNTFDAAAGTTYNVEVILGDATDQNRSNDTLKTTVTIAELINAPTASGVVCGTQAILKVTNPIPNANYFWYTSPTGNSSIAMGATATTPNIPANNTFYVGTGARGTVGAADNAVWGNGGGYLSGTANYMKYSASVPVILESAKLYTKAAGKIDFIVADIISVTGTGFTYSAISTTTIDVHSTSPNPAPGNQNVFDASDAGADFHMNLFLPAGDHVIIVRPQGNANLFRNTNVTGNPYPFTLGNLISFTGNGATQAGNPDYFQNFYYYLYNMKVRTSDCVSERTAVVAPVAPTPTIAMVGDSLVSSIATGNQWYRDGLIIAGANTQKHKPVQSGNYTVRVTDASGCQRSSTAIPFIASAVNPVDNAAIQLSVSPNPNNGDFVLKFRTARRNDMRIDIMNSLGQNVFSKAYPTFSGQFSEQLQLKQMGAGVYVLKLQHGEKIYYSKIVVER